MSKVKDRNSDEEIEDDEDESNANLPGAALLLKKVISSLKIGTLFSTRLAYRLYVSGHVISKLQNTSIAERSFSREYQCSQQPTNLPRVCNINGF